MINRYLVIGLAQIARSSTRTPSLFLPAEFGTKIIIPHAPDLQGATFTGPSQHRRKFSNVAGEHHFLCLLGGDLQRVTALATVATDG